MFFPFPAEFRNSLTEQRITETDRHGLRLCVVVQCSLAQLTANTRLLEATEGKLPVKSVVGVNPDSSCLQAVGNFNSSVQVGSVDCGSKTIGGVVANLDDFLLGLELGDGADRAEDFFLHDLHVFSDVGEDSRLDEVALVADSLTAGFDGGAGLLAFFDVAIELLVYNDAAEVNVDLPHNPVELEL
jgi:hypothetical protein